MSSDKIKQIEISNDAAQKIVAMRDAINRLQKNRDFRAVILDGYLRDEALRLSHLIADSSQAGNRDEIVRDLHGIGALNLWFRNQIALGNVMENDIASNNDELEYLRSEEAE